MNASLSELMPSFIAVFTMHILQLKVMQVVVVVVRDGGKPLPVW